MKKFVYSAFTKAVAVILFVTSIVLGTLSAVTGMSAYFDEDVQIYRFENDFSESLYFNHLISAPEEAIINAYLEQNREEENNNEFRVFSGYEIEDNPEIHADTEVEDAADLYIPDEHVTIDVGAAENRVKLQRFSENDNIKVIRITYSDELKMLINRNLDELYCSDRIDYFVEYNGNIFTNCGASSAQELMNRSFFKYSSRDAAGNTEYLSNHKRVHISYFLDDSDQFNESDTVTVCAAVKESYADECAAIWKRQYNIVNDTFTKSLAFVMIAVVLLAYLICVSGKNAAGEYKTMWLDRILAEIHLSVIALFGVGAVMICVIMLDEYQSGRFPASLLNMSAAAVSAVAGAAIITSLLSIIRCIKCGSIVHSSIICRIISLILRVIKLIYRGLVMLKNSVMAALSAKTGVILICMLAAYTVVIILCGVFAYETVAGILLAVPVFLLALFVVAHRAKDLDEIKKGVCEVRGGNLTYKIPQLKSEDMKSLANDVNEIALGLDESVAAKIRAERLKTELITNVSHDLKTPLTSIINYTELLSKSEGLTEEARDYIKIIASKSERLKNLTRDLFDISKAQSGNEYAELEKIDASILIDQTLGEHDNDIKNSGLTFCVNTERELYISADGRKMSRVMSNLISNILKYSMKGTRVFVSASEKDGMINVELKNIASYPMDFDADEIVGRFVRGDESRTDEGNGLGLAIAKSYTELCGGEFSVIIDGDMFKTVLRFRKYDN